MSVLRANPDQTVTSAAKLDPSIVEWFKVSVSVVAALGLSLFFVLSIILAPTTDTAAHSTAHAASVTRNQLRMLHEAAMIDQAGSYDVECKSGVPTGSVVSTGCADSSQQRKTRTDLASGFTD
jgi:hypothetical protein